MNQTQPPTPCHQNARITLYNCDCETVIGTPITAGVPVVITSPPYNLGAEPWPHLGNWKHGATTTGGRTKWPTAPNASRGAAYDKHHDNMPWTDYCAWQRRVITNLWNQLPTHGAIFYNHRPRVIGDQVWLPLELLPANVTLRQIIIWTRPGGRCANPNAFAPTHEWIMLMAKPAFRLKSRGASTIGDVWQMSPDRNRHPAPFPTALPAKIIEATGTDAVFDPFAGSGTTLVAAKRAGIRAVGCDISPTYCDHTVERLRQEILF